MKRSRRNEDLEQGIAQESENTNQGALVNNEPTNFDGDAQLNEAQLGEAQLNEAQLNKDADDGAAAELVVAPTVARSPGKPSRYARAARSTDATLDPPATGAPKRKTKDPLSDAPTHSRRGRELTTVQRAKALRPLEKKISLISIAATWVTFLLFVAFVQDTYVTDIKGETIKAIIKTPLGIATFTAMMGFLVIYTLFSNRIWLMILGVVTSFVVQWAVPFTYVPMGLSFWLMFRYSTTRRLLVETGQLTSGGLFGNRAAKRKARADKWADRAAARSADGKLVTKGGRATPGTGTAKTTAPSAHARYTPPKSSLPATKSSARRR